MSTDSALAPGCNSEILSEHSRREYLQAMEIVSWLPKDQPWQPITSDVALLCLSEVEEAPTRKTAGLTTEAINEPVISSAEKFIEPIQTQSTSIDKTEKDSNGHDHDLTPAESQYLKLVNWSNQSTMSNNSKRLLVICRHKVDEPANSFARATAPSQFMLDYIKSLVEMMRTKGVEIDVKLAHLSQVGLSDDSQLFTEGLKKSKPDCVLILGDETINQFVPNTPSVAELRGKQIKLNEQLNAFVSYHPFTLIQDPSLKRLAFEDLRQLTDFFNA